VLGRAHRLAPQERSVALLYAQANLQSGNAVRAAALLEPFAGTESDAMFLDTYGGRAHALGKSGACPGGAGPPYPGEKGRMTRLFDLSTYAAAGQDQKAVEILAVVKRRMFADKRQSEFAALTEALATKHLHSQAVLEFSASIYNELNRESQYFEILIKLFDVYLHSGNVAKAAESLERLVDIDAYDYRNQERLECCAAAWMKPI